MLLFFLAIFSYRAYAQEEAAYTLVIEDQSLEQILREISSSTSYKFAYSKSEVDTERKASFSFKNQSIESLMAAVAARFNLHWEIVGKTIILNTHSIREFYLIQGTVLDSKQLLPLQWVNISTLDNQHGSLTDSAGNFSLRIAADQKKIKFSFVGFKTQITEIKGDTSIIVLLAEDIKALEEIVVVAFGQENKDLITGSVACSRSESIYNQLNTESLNASLQVSLPRCPWFRIMLVHLVRPPA